MNITMPVWLNARRRLPARGCPSRGKFADKTTLEIRGGSLASRPLRVKPPRA